MINKYRMNLKINKLYKMNKKKINKIKINIKNNFKNHKFLQSIIINLK